MLEWVLKMIGFTAIIGVSFVCGIGYTQCALLKKAERNGGRAEIGDGKGWKITIETNKKGETP